MRADNVCYGVHFLNTYAPSTRQCDRSSVCDGQPWRCGRCRALHARLRASASAGAPSQLHWDEAKHRPAAASSAAELLRPRAEGPALQDLRRREAHLPPGPLRRCAAAAFDMAAFDAALSADSAAKCLAHVHALAVALDVPGARAAPDGRGRPAAEGASPPLGAAVLLERQRGARGPPGAPTSAARQYIGEVFRGRHTARPLPGSCAFPSALLAWT